MQLILPVSTTMREGVVLRLGKILRGLPQDKAWSVEIKPFKRRRSDSQNRYLWGVVYKTILDTGHLDGWDKDDVHEYFLGECFGWETLEGFGRRRMKPLKRSATLNKQEFSDYIDFIQRKMAELCVYIPDANGEIAA